MKFFSFSVILFLNRNILFRFFFMADYRFYISLFSPITPCNTQSEKSTYLYNLRYRHDMDFLTESIALPFQSLHFSFSLIFVTRTHSQNTVTNLHNLEQGEGRRDEWMVVSECCCLDFDLCTRRIFIAWNTFVFRFACHSVISCSWNRFRIHIMLTKTNTYKL